MVDAPTCKRHHHERRARVSAAAGTGRSPNAVEREDLELGIGAENVQSGRIDIFDRDELTGDNRRQAEQERGHDEGPPDDLVVSRSQKLRQRPWSGCVRGPLRRS